MESNNLTLSTRKDDELSESRIKIRKLEEGLLSIKANVSNYKCKDNLITDVVEMIDEILGKSNE